MTTDDYLDGLAMRQPDERLVQMYLQQMQAGKAITRPWLVRRSDGRAVPLSEDCLAKVEAVKRLGGNSLGAYTIESANTTPERLAKLRQRLEADRLERG
jgi:hypothetical protein